MAVTPEQAIRALLLDDTDTTDLVSTRIYPHSAPQNASLPYLVVMRIDTTGYHHYTAAAARQMARVQIEAYAATYDSGMTIAETVRQALDGYQGTVTVGASTLDVRMVKFESMQSLFISPPAGKETPVHWVETDYMVMHEATVPTFS